MRGWNRWTSRPTGKMTKGHIVESIVSVGVALANVGVAVGTAGLATASEGSWRDGWMTDLLIRTG